MAKSKKTTEPVRDDIAVLLSEYPIEIKEALIKDDLCNYSYEIIDGIGVGDEHSVKGTGIVDKDMVTAFSVFNVHMAVIDDVFKHADIQFADIDKMHGDELATIFTCTGFKIKGGKEDMSIILIGNKYVSAGGRIELKTPKIALDKFSSYKWAPDLKVAAWKACLEVLRYKDGKYTAIEVDEEEAPKQLKMDIGEPAKNTELDKDFANAAL